MHAHDTPCLFSFSLALYYGKQQAIGHAVTLCQPRALIAQSGILPVLGNMMPSSNTGASSSSPSLTSPGPVLAAVHAEFLQACVYAGHYAYAERSVTGTWPRPTGTVSVRNVLRYFYLRGVVHLACQRWELAVRCFRTCLCVPSEVVSAVQLAAWKKLVLVQCLVETDDAVAQPTTLPSPTSTCVYRFINAAVTESKAKAANQQHGTTTPARGAPEDASTTILHLVDNLETGDSSARENNNNNNRARYPSMGVAVYAALALAFCDMDRPALQRQLTEHERFLTADGNWGLAQQVATALPRRQLVSWSRVYSSISLDELADLLNLSVEDLSRLLLQVSIAKEWPIQVSDTRMITFSRLVPQIGDTARTTQELVALAKLVQKMDATLSASSKFLSLARKEGRDASSSGDKGNAPAPGPRGVEDI